MNVSFLLAEDPQRRQLGEYILHINRPIALIRVVSMDEADPMTGDNLVSKDYTYQGEDGYTEVFQLVVMPFTDGIVEFNKDEEEELLSMLDAAWKWYADYITWQDKNMGDE